MKLDSILSIVTIVISIIILLFTIYPYCKKKIINKILYILNSFYIEYEKLNPYIKRHFLSTHDEITYILFKQSILYYCIPRFRQFLVNFNKYDILTEDILNEEIYHPLEGYLFPDTYEFLSSASIKEIIEKMIATTESKLSGYLEEIENSEYSIHEIVTLASIVELEGQNKENRPQIAGVFINRMKIGDRLGSDVTTYYATQKQMGETLTYKDLMSENAYNTRNTNMLGLPVGPICNPSNISIDAVFNPSNTDYLYFYADIKTGLVYFAKTSAEFNQIIKEVG